MQKHGRLLDIYSFAGFRVQQSISGIFGDPKARVIRLNRRGKKRFVVSVAVFSEPSTTGKSAEFGICPAGTCAFTWRWKSGACLAEAATW